MTKYYADVLKKYANRDGKIYYSSLKTDADWDEFEQAMEEYDKKFPDGLVDEYDGPIPDYVDVSKALDS